MFITLQLAMEDGPEFITFDGTPKECQDQANAFIGDGIQVKRIILMGEK